MMELKAVRRGRSWKDIFWTIIITGRQWWCYDSQPAALVNEGWISIRAETGINEVLRENW